MVLTHLQQTPGLIQLTPKEPQTYLLTTQGLSPTHNKEPLKTNRLKEKWPIHSLSKVHATHIGNTPEAPDSGEHKTLQFRALQNLFS